MLAADRHRHAALDQVGHERHHDELLLERGQHIAHHVDGVECPGDAGDATGEHLVGCSDVGQRRERARTDRVDRGVAGRCDLADRTDHGALEGCSEMHAGRGEFEVVFTVDQCKLGVLHRSIDEHDHNRGQHLRQRHEVDPPNGHRLRAGSHDDRGVVGQRREQVRGFVEHLFEAAMGGSEKITDLAGRGPVESARRRQMIDEVPIALVGGDSTGRGVRLDQIPVLFELRHLVAHGRRRHANRRNVGDVTRTDRLRGRDVLLHHGGQDRCLAVVEHLALKPTERQPSGARGAAALPRARFCGRASARPA